MVENKLLGKTFFWMFLGLLGSAIIAAYTYYSGLFIDIVIGDYFNILLISELVVVFVFSLLFRKMSPTLVGILYFVYAALNGVTLSTIFAVYQLNSILLIFGVTALIYGVLGLIGYKTDKDLSSWGIYLRVFLIAGILVSIINLFMGNSTIDIILDWAMLILFFGITIYDLNKIKLLEQTPEIASEKLHIYCAMQLYLDFINIFLRILSLFGKRKN